MKPEFNSRELSVLRLLSDRHHSGNCEVSQLEVKRMIGDREAESLFSRLRAYKMIEWVDNNSFVASSPLLNHLHEIDNQPIPNRLNEFTSWWFRSYWRTGFTVFGIAFPVVWQWFEIAIAITGYLNSIGK